MENSELQKNDVDKLDNYNALKKLMTSDIDKQIIFDLQKEITDRANALIDSLGIPVIRGCTEVITNGFIIGVSSIEDVKHLISERSICVYFVEKVLEGDYIGDISQFIGKEKIIEIYIRLGETNTWIKYRPMMLIHFFLELNFKNSDEDEDDYEDEDEDSDYEEEVIDYDGLNTLATIVAKSKGFNFLKNKDQRSDFAKDVLKKIDAEFSNYDLVYIVATAETFYDLGVLPTTVKKLHLEGEKTQDIAKSLGHTKARIEKALLCDVSDKIKKYIEE